MKKKVLWALMLCLVLILALALVACGSKTNTGTDNGSTPSGDTGSGGSGGQSGGGSGGSGNQGGGQQGGGGSGGGSGGGGQGGQSLNRTLPTEEAILQVVGTAYFKLAVGNLSGSAVTTVATDGTYYYFANPSVTFGKLINNYAFPYTKQSGRTKYTKMETKNTIPTLIHMGNVGNLFLYAGETISYETEEDVTFIGRPAKKYTVTYTDPGNNAHVQELVIDNATGACLKHDSASAPNDGFTSGSSRESFAATEIEYGTGNTVVSSFLNTYINNIDVFEWDVDYLAQAGLTTAASPANNWEFTSSKFANNSSRDDDYPEWSVYYNYYTADVSGTKDSMETFIQSFYDAGAKYEDTVQKSFDELCSYDTDDNSFYFYGEIASTGYSVLITINNNSVYTNRHWEISVKVYLEETY